MFAEWGHIDVLVNNGRYVGPGHMDFILDTPVRILRDHLEANVLAPVVLIKAIVPKMIERGSGTVINITSGAGYADPPAAAGQGGWGLGYGASKGAMHRIAGILALETAGLGVRAFNVQPGFIATERMVQDMGGFGFDASSGRAAGASIGRVCVWLLESPDADAAQRSEHRGARAVRRAEAACRVGRSVRRDRERVARLVEHHVESTRQHHRGGDAPALVLRLTLDHDALRRAIRRWSRRGRRT